MSSCCAHVPYDASAERSSDSMYDSFLRGAQTSIKAEKIENLRKYAKRIHARSATSLTATYNIMSSVAGIVGGLGL